MTFLVTVLVVALTVKVAALLVWAWSHGTLRTSDQEVYDWKFESIIRNETGEFPDRRHPGSISGPLSEQPGAFGEVWLSGNEPSRDETGS